MTTTTLLCIGPGSKHLSSGLYQLTGFPQAEIKYRTFPDQEVCVRVETPLRGQTVIIVNGTHPPQEQHLQQLYQLVEIAAGQGAKHIVCIVPYLAYARQDRRTHPGEPLSGFMVLRTLAMLGAEVLVTIDVHSQKMFEQAPLATVNLTTASLFADWLLQQNLVSPVLVSPDENGRQRVEAVAQLTGYNTLIYNKHKDETGRTWYEQEQQEQPTLTGRDIVVLDDLCSSGTTFIPLARYLKRLGGNNFYFGVSHFFADGNQIQEKLGFQVTFVGTDTIPTTWSRVPVTPLIAGWIKEYLAEKTK